MLEGIRVVELGVWVAGPAAAGIMADWGADVIKVEAPSGDPMRRMLAVTAGGRGDLPSPPFDLDNRGKRSVVFDLETDEGRDAMDTLLETADVFMTNLRPEAVDRLGLGPEAVRAAHPRLVYATVTGYGREGPETWRAGYDVGAFWARSGLAALAVPPDDPQPQFRGGVGDHVTAITTLAGILGALWQRERTGEGQVVETSLLRTGIYCLGWDLGIQLRLGKLASTLPRTEQSNPMINVYRAADEKWFWLLGVEADRMWPKLLRAVDRDRWADDDRYRTARDRRYNAKELIAELDELFASRARAEWTAVLDEHDVWWAPVNTAEDVVNDPQAIAAGAFVDVPDGLGSDAHRAVATPVRFTDAGDAGPRGPVPGLGEHTEEVRRELGLA
ncbi:MAG TPA: CoA transferase [Acidimicrobiales bacterium]|jgi:crotonobetainyl-CoA:carnitine CoA-transferase CaiB-like acyl-CoA transferase|nr:CoA transferase [Acidimicrobiales bacterium]